jgi:hypothetical protein
MEHWWNEIFSGKPKYSGNKNCPSATLSTINPTWTDPGSSPVLRGERPATNRLTHGPALSLERYCYANLLDGRQWQRAHTHQTLGLYGHVIFCSNFINSEVGGYFEPPSLEASINPISSAICACLWNQL